MLSGQPTNDTINLLLKNNAPFWQWFDGSQAADGLNMTCNHKFVQSLVNSEADADMQCRGVRNHSQLDHNHSLGLQRPHRQLRT